MSTPITSDQTLRNVASTLYSATVQRSDAIKRAAQKVITQLLGNDAVSQTEPTEVIAALHHALRENNIRSVAENYPDNADYINQAMQQPVGDIDINADTIPLSSPDGAIFFMQQLGRIEQGLFGETAESITAEIESLKQAMAVRLAVLNTPNYNAQGTPDLLDIADKMLKLGAHGDFLYGMNRGFYSVIGRLELAASSPDLHYGDNLFVSLLKQAYESGPMTLPVGPHPFNPIPTYTLRNPDYKITSDIPFPQQSDADDISRAAVFLAHRLDQVPLMDTAGNPIDSDDKDRIQGILMDTVASHVITSNHLRFADYEGMEGITFKDALARKDSRYAPSETLYLVSIDDMEPITPSGKRDHRMTETVQKVQEMVDQSKGKVMPVGDSEDILALKARFPFLSVETFNLSPIEKMQLRSYSYVGDTLTATEVLLRHAIQSAHENLGLDEQGQNIERGPIVVEMIRQIQESLPGLDDEFMAAVEQAVLKNYPSFTTQTPKYVAKDILAELPKAYRENIQSPGAPRTISPELAIKRDGSEEDLPLSHPTLTR